MHGERLAALVSCLITGWMAFGPLAAIPAQVGSEGPPATPPSPRGPTPDNDSEPNNDFDNATLVTGSRSFKGGVGMGDSFDYFKIWLDTANFPGGSGDVLRVELRHELGMTSLRIWDTYRRELLMEYPTGAGGSLSATFAAHVSGYHYIQLQDNGPCNYTLTTTVTSAPYMSDGDNDAPNATDIDAAGYPYQREATVNNSTDIYDLYKIRLNSTPGLSVDVIKVFLQVPSSADINLQLYRAGEWGPVADSVTLAEGVNESFTYSAGATGDYYLRVWAPRGSGSYMLRVSKFTGVSDGNDLLEYASEMMKSDAHWYNVSGDLALGIDPDDYYQISGVYPEQVFNCTVTSLNYDPTDTTPNIRIILLNGTGVELPPDPPDNLARPTAEANGVAGDDGRMYIQLNLTRWAGSYDLRVRTNAPPQVLQNPPNVSIPENGTSDDIKLARVFEDPDGDPLEFTYELYGGLEGNLEVSIGADPERTVTLSPRPGWTGAGQMVWTATDPSGLSATSMVELLLVHRINHRPEVIDPSPPLVILEKNKPDFDSLNMKSLFYDPDGDKLWYNVSGNVSLRVTFALDKSNHIDHTGEVTLIPEIGFVGVETLVFTATDNGLPTHLTSDPVTVTVEVREQSVVERITVGPIPPISLSEDGSDSSLDLSAYFSSNLEGDNFTFEHVPSAGSHLSVSLSGSVVTITPQPDWSGIETLTFVGTCSHGQNATATVAVEVMPVNDPPEIVSWSPQNSALTITEGESALFQVSATDVETPGTGLKVRWTRDGANVSSLSSYNLTTDFDTVVGAASAVLSINVSVSDGQLSVLRNWTVTVLNLNRPPRDVRILSPVSNAAFDEGASIKFQGAAEDEDGDELSYTWWEGAKQLGEGMDFKYSKLRAGKHTITLRVSDGSAEGTAAVNVKINKKSSPGFEALWPLAAVLASALLMRRRLS
ncbi:MAG: Ig-like domain-containing protein [Thermoplasmatota archaeon]